MLLRLLPIICALLFILTRTANIRVIKSKETTVKINFNIIAIILHEEKFKSIRLRSVKGLIKKMRCIYRSIEYLLSKSTVVFCECNNNAADRSGIFPLHNIYTLATRQLALSYLKRSARRFAQAEHPDSCDFNGNLTEYELKIYFSLWHLIISALILLYYIMKSKVKRVFKNV